MGKIGSGKTSFLHAILGEMRKVQGAKTVNGRMSYVAQQAWIQNLTLKDNILFGSAVDSERYNEVVNACALASDLELLPNNDDTEIGENGVNLSGGQKQRVGLARSAYHVSDIVLMDDPLSAVDAHVAKHIFDQLIGPNGWLKGRTRILVTHNLGFLHKVDRILLFHEGRIVDQGSLEQLQMNQSHHFEEMSEFVGKNREIDETETTSVQKKISITKEKKSDGQLTQKENQTH